MSILLPPNYAPDEYSEKVLHLMEHSYDNLLISGRAGTGKSTLIEYYRSKTKRNYILLASTGVAAMNIGGQTIHSFFGIPPRVMRPDDPDIQAWPKTNPKLRVLQQLDTIIIDEVSMMRADLLDAIDESLRLQLGSNLPFGGIQMVLVGDSFQLAPVDRVNEVDDDPYLKLPPRREYKSPFFFSAEAFKKGGFKLFELQFVYRQSAGVFLDLLNQVRLGYADHDTLEALNARVDPEAGHREDKQVPILLTSTNRIADEENNRQLRALSGRLYQFDASIDRVFPAHLCRAESLLEVKIGARVMMLTNDSLRRWSNGSLGTLLAVNEDDEEGLTLTVKFDRGNEETVSHHTWENISYKFSDKDKEIDKEVKGTFSQFPLRLAWAVTVHKSQGLTFDKMRLDIGSGAFAPGQLYVALSRCRTLDGITLRQPLTQRDIIVADVVNAFAKWATSQMQTQDHNPTHIAARRPEKPAAGGLIQKSKEDKAEEERKKQQKQAKALAELQDKNLAGGKLANEGARYLKADLELLRERFEARVSIKDIAAEMQRKPGGVGSKLRGMGLIVAFSLSPAYVVLPDPDYMGPEPPAMPEPAEGETAPSLWTSADDQKLQDLLTAGTSYYDLLAPLQLTPTGLIIKLVRLQLIPEEGLRFAGVWFRWDG